MNQKIKTIVIFAVLVIVIGGSSIAYSLLKDKTADSSSNIQDIVKDGITASGEEKERIPAPDFSVTDRDGKKVLLSSLFGKPIVLNFWASWCPPCKAEMPHFNDVYKEYKNDVIFMMVDLIDGQRETVSIGKKYVQDQGFEFPVYFDVGQEAADAYSISSIPTTLFIDKDGMVVTGFQGSIDENTLKESIELAKK
ncbi:MAG: TlpA family protein disulfide reductase [Saccharofermentanales bacterium]